MASAASASASKHTGYTERGEYATPVQITSEDGMKATISTLGARLLDLQLPKGKSLLLPLASLKAQHTDDSKINAVIGRVANRIANGRMTRYPTMADIQLQTNDSGLHSIHGGVLSWDRRLFSVKSLQDRSVVLEMVSPHGDNGFPSSVRVTVKYNFTDKSQLTQVLITTNIGAKPTVTNMTTHPYFDLTGNGGRVQNSAQDYTVHAPNCNKYLVLTDSKLPTGDIAPVNNTSYDFTKPRKLHDGHGNFEGYDNYWVSSMESALDPPLAELVTVVGPTLPSGASIELKVSSNQPGFQMYSANHFDASPPAKYAKFGSLAIEPSGFIDACNQPSFPTIELKPDETRRQVIRYTIARKQNK